MKNMKTNYQSHRKSIPLSLDFCSDVSLPVANKLLCSVVSLPVANKLPKVSVKHPDDKWITDVLTKTLKCQPAVRDSPETGPHTPRVTVGVPDSGLARQQNKNKQNKKHKNHKSNYLSNVTLVDSVKHTKLVNQSQVTLAITAIRSRSRSRLVGHGSHTPRVTVSVTDSDHNSKFTVIQSRSRSRLSGHGPHTPRVTVGVPDSGSNSKLAVLKSRSRLIGHGPHTSQVTVGVPVSGHNFKLIVFWVTVMVTALRSMPTNSASHCGYT